ncbi:uncharacterized protein [Venturia canescens]|uniref:uncharacterized protein n=1 Tax=Venturia canescens TaxID=32260 RepID=UPI001C9D3C29|nr:uncharacterized protein LOC122419315 [Venturia canescens]
MESSSVENHFSIKMTRFYMQVVGMWYVEKKRDKIISNVVLVYTVLTMLVALVVMGTDFFYSWGDLHAITYNAPCTITVLIELFKLIVFLYNRQKVMDLNAFTEHTFWKKKYELMDLLILNKCNEQTLRMNIILAVLMQIIAWHYLSIPMVESIGKDHSQRILPFRLWFNLPFTETPYYEVAFGLQAAATLSVSVCTTTFASFLFTVCVYATGQFKILQRRIENSCDMYMENMIKDYDGGEKNENELTTYNELKNCIRQHQLLIDYMDEVENLYCYIMMGQGLGAVLQICFSGFQVLLGADESVLRTALSIEFFWGAVIILYLFSWACHEIALESTAIAEAAYRAFWYALPYHSRWGRAYLMASQFVTVRARKPCILTVGKFTPMTLETFTSVLSTSLSYFSILRQMNDDALRDCSTRRMALSDLSNSPAIRLTRFFMRFTGFWIPHSKADKLLMNLMTGYTIIAIAIAGLICSTDLIFSLSDFHQATYTACNMMTVLTICIKLIMFLIQRDKFMKLIQYCYKNLWKAENNAESLSIMRSCELRCIYFVVMFTFFALSTVCTYTAYPIIENMGKNDTDRIHPFTLWINLPTTSTPYFETIFTIEILSCFHSGICYFCFDNFLCIINVFTAGHFRMLQRKLKLMRYADGVDSNANLHAEISANEESSKFSKIELIEKRNGSNDTLKDCIKEHQALIAFIESVEELYTLVILGQVVIFSLLICLVSYQAVLADGEFSRRMIFIVHSAGTFTQLFMFTLTCDDLIRESQAVADAAYSACWYYCLSDPSRRTLGKDLMFLIMRARRPCCLTAGGFCAISLETFTTILSSAMSYLTLLRN